jgi:hypothetical protein
MRCISLAAWVVGCAVLTAVSMQGQAPPPPAAELQRLDFLTGHWTAEGTYTGGPPGTPSTIRRVDPHAPEGVIHWPVWSNGLTNVRPCVDWRILGGARQVRPGSDLDSYITAKFNTFGGNS